MYEAFGDYNTMMELTESLIRELAQLVVMDNCGHQPEVEKPDEFVKLVQNFLSEN